MIKKAKPFLSFEDQVSLLADRGLIIDNQSQAIRFLSSNNYYRLNYYFHKYYLPQQKAAANTKDTKDIFIPGTTFIEIQRIYENDQWLRQLISGLLKKIEIYFGTSLSHYLAQACQDPNCLYCKEHADVISQIESILQMHEEYKTIADFVVPMGAYHCQTIKNKNIRRIYSSNSSIYTKLYTALSESIHPIDINRSIFKDTVAYLDFYASFSNDLLLKEKKIPFIKHYLNEYDGKLPIWAMIETFTFGAKSKLFSMLKNDLQLSLEEKISIKNEVSQHLFIGDEFINQELPKISVRKLSETYTDWMKCINSLRNLCAHFDPLFRRSYSSVPLILSMQLPLSDKDEMVDQNSLYQQCFILRWCSKKTDWDEFCIQLYSREQDKNYCFDLADYGFPASWRKYLNS